MTNQYKTIVHSDRGYRMAAGITSLFFFVLLAAYHLYHGTPYNILWTCHMACLLSGLGLIFTRPMLNAVGFFWLCFGVPLWGINVLTGDELILLSIPTHIGGLLISVWGLKKMGIPRHTWFISSISLIMLGFLSRLITPFDGNINLSHTIWKGYEPYFSSFFGYVIFVNSCSIVTFLVLEFSISWMSGYRKNDTSTQNHETTDRN